MESYKELRERQQQEVNDFPLGFAFGNKQFEEMMAGWGLDAKKDSDLAQVASLFGGAYILKKDVPAYKDMSRRHREELAAAIEADETGETRKKLTYHINTAAAEAVARKGHASYPEDFPHLLPGQTFAAWRVGDCIYVETTLDGAALMERLEVLEKQETACTSFRTSLGVLGHPLYEFFLRRHHPVTDFKNREIRSMH